MALNRSVLVGLILILSYGTVAEAAQAISRGNINKQQPAVPGASARRTQAANTTYQAKYSKVLQLLRNDHRLRSKIKQVAAQYGIAPIHMIGAIVGEHTYNVDAYDRLQTYYVKAASYLTSTLSFSHGGESLEGFLDREEFETCSKFNESYALWTCRESIWDTKFRGRKVAGKSFPDNRFSAVFLQPLYAGQTFGIGQLNPLTALQLTDYVQRVSGYAKLDYRKPREVYQAIMDPDISLAYMAAAIRKSIDAYAKIANFDISKNPGITSTLYNIGNPEARASILAAENANRRRQGRALKLPEENYYGWLINEKQTELEALVSEP